MIMNLGRAYAELCRTDNDIRQVRATHYHHIYEFTITGTVFEPHLRSQSLLLVPVHAPLVREEVLYEVIPDRERRRLQRKWCFSAILSIYIFTEIVM